ncbi:BamA/TamA family outer membrane protein [Aureibacter tunicatorum]|uniref:Bacterial surface antigen (D15) domain-containing protein n=1 Tax=Aureibacter tunicatorum TaxID=866807 RepID=A0AAE4BUR1_9BACT|nr:BamA/TamA family outer membrane protein [Aureibacter tunicatorum]MDR6241062.1 hypothetical protein [Aureibacter tunicatorum]BDD03840.1 hypothetical protein AUTU_13230 [Aureibacter tunicatorum]
MNLKVNVAALVAIIAVFFCVSNINLVKAAELDTLATDSVKAKRNLRFSMLGGPGYSPDFGFLIGGSALFTFSTNPADTALKRSVVPVAFAYMANGGGSAIIRPQLFFNHDRFRIFGQISAKNTIENYYGIGYANNSEIEKGETTTEYRNIGYRFNPVLLFRYKKTDLFLGGSIDISQQNITEPSQGVMNDPVYIAQGGDSTGLKFFNVGLGVNFNYDTRDVPANAYSGMLLEFSATYYSKSFGGESDYGVYNFNYRQFKELKFLGERKVLAWMLKGQFTSGDVPLTEYAPIGSPFDLRGYYMGQYRDSNSMAGVVEYRHMFNMGDETWLRRLGSKMGFAAWCGLGSIGPDMSNWSPLLPNYGVGIRIEVQPRMNFRMDIGKDPINNQTLLYFNMTEAF